MTTTTLKSCMQPQSYALNCKLGCLQPAHRVAWKEYLDHGLVLPLSADKGVHDQLNPYLHNSSVTATLADGSSPLDGWDPSSLLAAATRENLPPMDLYGHLFFHLLERLSTFISRLHSCQVHFRYCSVPVFADFSQHLAVEGGDFSVKFPHFLPDSFYLHLDF